jgi:hypothetical protein
MKKFKKIYSAVIAGTLIALTTIVGIAPAQAQIDVSDLQTCLKEEGSALNVLVLMDSSGSLRDATEQEIKSGARTTKKGSDPEGKRGKILKSSLKILRTLAEESDRDFNISLRNFGKNSDPVELGRLKERWVDWTGNTSDQDLTIFVEKAVYDDSPGTQWTNGLISAKAEFKKKIDQAKLSGTRSCSIMFWITDGAPSDSTQPICAPTGEASINWFRENNILILGGLLKPQGAAEAAKADQFGPLVRGKNCGETQKGWTTGEVIVANEIDDLAWEFVGLIAGIKNLINLNGNGSTFNVDPSTSHIEIYTRKTSGNWEIKMPDGSVFCSKSNAAPKCIVKEDPEVGITTIEIYPDKPVDSAGTWSISPGIKPEDFLVYGGLSTNSGGALRTKPNLVITDFPAQPEEGKETSFLASLKNADGTPFSLSGYKSVTICAKIASSQVDSCVNGKSAANLTVIPATTDKSVSFEAVLISEKNPTRSYIIPATVKIEVIASGFFPSLVCEKDPCVLNSLANKNSPGVSILRVEAPTSGTQDGTVTLLGATILADQIEGRGDGGFQFVIEKENGEIIQWNNQSQDLKPGDKLTLTVSTDQGGKSEIQGFLKYKVSANGQEIVRQLDFKFNVEAAKSWPILIALMLLAYLITVGLPYAYLLWLARKRAVLTVADNEYAYLEEPVTILQSGKVVSKASKVENALATALDPSHEGLKFEIVEEGARAVSIGNVHIEVIPPKWNPFVEPATHIYVKDNHVLSTFGGSEFLQDRTFFTRSLTGEAILFFPSQESIAPRLAEQIDTFEPLSRTDLFATTSSKPQSAELVISSGEIFATALYLVPRYENRRKSLSEANSKLKNTIESANLSTHIVELRQNALNAELLRIEELKKAEQAQTGKKKLKKEVSDKKSYKESLTQVEPTSTRFSIFEEELNTGGKSLFSNETDTPNPESGKKLWD